jgi:hypothetical protein
MKKERDNWVSQSWTNKQRDSREEREMRKNVKIQNGGEKNFDKIIDKTKNDSFMKNWYHNSHTKT